MRKLKVLFLCTGNSARSQMAEGFLRHLAGDNFEVFSAGVTPTQVNPLAIKVMQEVGIDISKHRSKSVMEFIKDKFDYVITVCDHAKQTCPIFLGEYKKIHWNLEDPANVEGTEEEKLLAFRITRDKIKKFILDFIKATIDNP
ncbi:MAG: arsenate reductase ArsC [Candidatus Omnitrophica bacterium]|nr:arsenate reductase ArsC [Candidatus Omnitrophota bacterium]